MSEYPVEDTMEHTPDADDAPESRRESPAEADPADAAEQAAEVPVDEDEWR